MGELQERLDEVQGEIKRTYNDIMNILEDKYCWKCPMRSTSTHSRCREIHAGRVLQEAADEGIITHLLEAGIAWIEVEALMTRMLKKKIKRQGGKQREINIIMKVEAELNPDLPPNSWLKIKLNPRRVKVGSSILISETPIEDPLLGSYALVAGFSFRIALVKRTFHEGNFWFVEVENGDILSLESVFGEIIKVFEDD